MPVFGRASWDVANLDLSERDEGVIRAAALYQGLGDAHTSYGRIGLQSPQNVCSRDGHHDDWLQGLWRGSSGAFNRPRGTLRQTDLMFGACGHILHLGQRKVIQSGCENKCEWLQARGGQQRCRSLGTKAKMGT